MTGRTSRLNLLAASIRDIFPKNFANADGTKKSRAGRTKKRTIPRRKYDGSPDKPKKALT